MIIYKPITTKAFNSGRTFYYIKDFKVIEATIHSGMSISNARILSKVFILYDTWSEANEALNEYKAKFTK